MIDVRTWNTIVELLSVIDHNRRPDDQNTDAMGNIHVILFGDFKPLGCNLMPIRMRHSQSLRDLYCVCRQLPPATSQALGLARTPFTNTVHEQHEHGSE